MTTKAKGTAKTMNAGAEAAKVAAAAFGPAFDEGFKAFREGFGGLSGGYEDFAQIGRDNLEAAMASGNLAVKAMQGLNAEVLAYSKVSMDVGTETAKAMMKAKDFKDVVDLQSDYAKKTLDGATRECTKLGEMASNATRESFDPINRRVNETLEKFTKVNGA
jgi:phasin family protein